MPRHPQDTPLKQWTDGWLKMAVASHIGVEYIMMADFEKEDKKLPLTRDEMIQFLIDKKDIPKAGIE